MGTYGTGPACKACFVPGDPMVLVIYSVHPFHATLPLVATLLLLPCTSLQNDRGDREKDYYYDEDREGRGPRRREGARVPARRRGGGSGGGSGSGSGGGERRPVREQSTGWNVGWFRDAQQADQGGMFMWVRK